MRPRRETVKCSAAAYRSTVSAPRGERVAGAQRDDEPVLAEEQALDVGQRRRSGPGRQVHLSAPQLGGVGGGLRHQPQPHPGACRCTAATRAGPHAAVSASCQRTVNTRSSVSSSSSRRVDSTAWARCTRSCTSSRSASACAVGTIVCPERTRTGSPVALRIRPSVRLIAGAVTCNRAAAPATLPSSRSASRAVSRFRSNCMWVSIEMTNMHLWLIRRLPNVVCRPLRPSE